MALPRVYIDGEAGTTGLQIAARLQARRDLALLSIEPELRKDETERAGLMNEADIVILCLPDDAARGAAGLVTNPGTVIIDASSAHRVADGWTYGFPEMDADQRGRIRTSKRISNPGCYPLGFIALVRPLIKAGFLPADYPVTVHAVSGYSGGGKAMIADFEADDGQGGDAFRAYGLELDHKHLPEMTRFTGLDRPPVFSPAVGRFAQGMLVEVPLSLWSLPGNPARAVIWKCLADMYASEPFVRVTGLVESDAMTAIEPQACNGSNRLDIFVFGGDEQVRLVARLDNLGKGASGAAVQNMNIVLGLEEETGL